MWGHLIAKRNRKCDPVQILCEKKLKLKTGLRIEDGSMVLAQLHKNIQVSKSKRNRKITWVGILCQETGLGRVT